MVGTIDPRTQAFLNKRLSYLASRLRWPQYWQVIWDHLLTEKDRASVETPNGKRPDPIYLWARLWSIPPVIAALDLAHEVELIGEKEHQRLLKTVRAIADFPASEIPSAKLRQRAPDNRRMVRSKLLGKPTYLAQNGTRVHIWERDGKYIARGSIQGDCFGVTLGETEAEAEVELRNMLVTIDRGAFVRPSEAKQRRKSSFRS